jgi:hypothetical protein
MSNFYDSAQKLLFIHLPKTGGWSIRHNLLKERQFSLKINPKWEYDFSFSIVRNPFDRFFSAYNMFKFGTTSLKVHYPDITVDEMLSFLENESIPYHNGRRGGEVVDHKAFIKHHIIPMTHSSHSLDKAHKIYRFENFSHAIDDLNSRLGLKVSIPHTNKPLKKATSSYKNFFTPPQKEKMFSIFKKDIDDFNYSF